MNLIKIEYIFVKQLKMQPSELWSKPFYEIEYLLEIYEEDMKEQEKRNKEEEAKQKKDFGSYGDIGKQMSSFKNDFNNMQSSFKMPGK